MVDYVKRPPASSGGGVSLSKVTLTKSSPTVSLAKGTGAGGQMRVALDWNPRATSTGGGGFFKKLTGASTGIDLDLGAMWEMQNGRKGVVQALGNAFGSLQQAPYVQLSGDDRTGGGGETMTIDLDHWSEMKRVLVFAYIYDGVPAWDKADGVVTLFPVGGPEITVPLDEPSTARMCAIALLTNEGGQVKVDRQVRYVDGAQDALDRAYGWGMDWKRGRK